MKPLSSKKKFFGLSFTSLVAFFVIAVSTAGSAYAADLPGVDLGIQDVFKGLACWLMRVSGSVMIIFLVIVGIKFMNAKGDPTKYNAAKKELTYVLIGMVVILGAYVIIATVAKAVGSDFSFVPLAC
mgnify:CR=1 FL=1